MPTRRDFLTQAAASAAAAIAAPAALAGAEPTLSAIGRAKGIEIGSCYYGGGSAGYRDLLRAHCGLLVHEWQLKPRFLRPEMDGPYRFGEADEVARFARGNGLKMHGHTLYWHAEPVLWAERGDFGEVKRRYGGFLRDVVGRYPDIVSWDVMNEIVEERTPLRDDFLLTRFGYDFIDFCFRTVAEAAPEARLVLNDYNLECSRSWCEDKRANMLAVLKTMIARGTPVHALGIQSHLSSRYRPAPRETLAFIERVAELGLDVYISELDVNDIDFDDDIAARDRQVADTYEEFLSAVLRHKAVKRVVFWGISDSASWIVKGGVEGSRGADARPALFDANDDPKPAFAAVRRALEAAPPR